MDVTDNHRWRKLALIVATLLCITALVACEAETSRDNHDEAVEGQESGPEKLDVPTLSAAVDGSRPVKVLATTGIIGDVVQEIVGEDGDVVVLMAADQDPHSFQVSAGDLRQAADADVIFVNGWQLEENLLDDLSTAASGTPLVPVSAGIEPRMFAEEEAGSKPGHKALRVDPHVWLAPLNVVSWVENISTVMKTIDPAHAEHYADRAESYRVQLGELDAYYQERIADLTGPDRVLVTNHDSFGYFADSYGFEVVGTVLPGDSTLIEPSSRDLVALLESMETAGTCSIFVDRGASQEVARQLSDDLDHCQKVQIVALYSGALGPHGSGAETYLTMMRANVDAIVDTILIDVATNGRNETGVS